MALEASQLAEIDALLGTQSELRIAVATLRQRFPGMTVTQCDPSDVDLESPFRKWSQLALYLVDSSDHCWRLTTNANRATGLVVVNHASSR